MKFLTVKANRSEVDKINRVLVPTVRAFNEAVKNRGCKINQIERAEDGPNGDAVLHVTGLKVHRVELQVQVIQNAVQFGLVVWQGNSPKVSKYRKDIMQVVKDIDDKKLFTK